MAHCGPSWGRGIREAVDLLHDDSSQGSIAGGDAASLTHLNP